MTKSEYIEAIKSTQWFCNIGNFKAPSNMLSIPNFLAWGGVEAEIEKEYLDIADLMDHLPSTHNMEDPFYGHSLQAEVKQLPKEERNFRLEVHKALLVSFRSLPDFPMFHIGPYDYTNAAKGALLFAARAAAGEILLGKEGKWAEIMELFFMGHWPCGIMEDGRIVVL